MKFKPTHCKRRNVKRAKAGFTLAEILAALLLLTLVIPAAVQGLRTANLAGVVGERKAVAARIGESVMNEAIVTGQLQSAEQSGAVLEGPVEYQWSLQVEPWEAGVLSLGSQSGTSFGGSQSEMSLVTVQVTFPAQGQDYDVSLSTLVDLSQ